MEEKGIEYLRRKLALKRGRVLLRYQYYEMKNATRDFNLVTPKEFRALNETLGWCGKAVDALADRLVFREFREDNFDLNTIYRMNNADVLFDSAVLSALISSCCFIYISADDDGFPQMQVIDGGNATGILDEITGLLHEGYAVLERDDDNRPTLEAWFRAGETVYYPKGGAAYTIQNAAPATLNTDRVDGLLNKICAADNYDDVAWALGEPVKTFSRSVVDDTVKANVEFQGESGLSPKIIRKASSGACQWCLDVAGTYTYPNVPKDVYRRHRNCSCSVEYDPGSGKRQNVWTKKWTSADETDTIELRKRIGLSNLDAFRASDYDTTINSFVSTDRKALVSAAQNGARHTGVYKDANAKTKKQLQKSIVSRTSQVERHADKIKNPETYVVDWANKSQRYQSGLLRKWEKDMKRNAEQAEIEIAVFESRFGK